MVKRKNFARKKISIFDLFNVVFMLFLTILFFYPFWHTLVISFSPDTYATSLGLKLFPPEISLNAYKKVLGGRDIWVAYGNTIWRTVVGTVLAVLVSYCAAYSMARPDLPGKKYISFYMIFTMLFGGGLIPTFLVMKSYGLVGSRWALILPTLASAWNITIARNYIAGLPRELEEAALVDGAHPVRVAFQIFLPLSKPIVAVLALWSAVGHWNAWFDALIYCEGDKGLVLQGVLRRLLMEGQAQQAALESMVKANTTMISVKCATIIVAILPIICTYPFAQKYFVKGVTIGAVKG